MTPTMIEAILEAVMQLVKLCLDENQAEDAIRRRIANPAPWTKRRVEKRARKVLQIQNDNEWDARKTEFNDEYNKWASNVTEDDAADIIDAAKPIDWSVV